MIWVRVAPGENLFELSANVLPKVAALRGAEAKGARFLALPVGGVLDASAWILASFHSGVTVVPFPHDLPASLREARLAQLPANQVIFPEHLSLSGPAPASAALRPLTEIWAVIFTSGTSGAPKGVALSGSALKSAAEMHRDHSGAAGLSWLLNLPLYHVGGLSVLTRALFIGGDVALGSPKFDAAETAQWLRSGEVRGLSLVPTTLARILREPGLDLTKLALILLGGAPTHPELLSRAKEAGTPVRLTYGMTEHSSQIATERAAGAGLEPLPRVELRISDDGEILVRSPALASGTFEGGNFKPLPLTGGFFATGDLGEFSGNRLKVSGRKSELIISGGKKIFPAQVEGALLGCEPVADVAVFGAPDEEWGELVCAAFVEKAGKAFDPAWEKENLLKVLEPFQLPKKWIRVEKIPRGATGKISRADLRALISSRN